MTDFDDDDWDEDDFSAGDLGSLDFICANCGERNAWDMCGCCGVPLCSMCFECGCGFCNDCPTEVFWQEEETETEHG